MSHSKITDEDRKDRRESITKYGKRAQGRDELLKHIKGKRLTMRQMILAKCYECMAYYGDRKADCKIPLCPLYPLMPFRKGEKYQATRLSEATKAAMTQRLREYHGVARGHGGKKEENKKEVSEHPPKKRKRAAKQ